MNDDAIPPRPGEQVAWSPFDPHEAPRLSPAREGAGRVVALLRDAASVEPSWASRAALELARLWSDSADPAVVPTVVVVDADGATAGLHVVAGTPAAPGLLDVLAGHCSLADATHEAGERTFVVPHGLPAAGQDAEAGVIDPDRWDRLCTALTEAGMLVAALVTDGTPAAETVLATATDVVALVGPGRLEELGAADDPRLRAAPGPLRPEAAGGPARAPAEGEGEGAWGAETLEPDRPDLPEPRARRRLLAWDDPPPRRVRRRIGAACSLLAAAAASGLGLHLGLGATGVAGGAPAEPAGTEAGGPPPRATPTAGAPPGAPVAPRPLPVAERFTLAVGAYRTAAAAERRAAAIARLVPDAPVLLAPVRVGGAVYHRVLAGLFPDSAGARRLAARLEAAGAGAASSWIVRDAALAFDLGEVSGPEAARAGAGHLRAKGVPAVPTRVQYSDCSVRYRIVAGAYAAEHEAAYLREILVGLGLEDPPLRPRPGLPDS